MRIKLTVSYIGTRYNGYQSQPNGNTVQDKLEHALGKYFDCDSVKVYGAGRTDQGVHADGQVVHFDIDKQVNCYKLCLGVNIYLPTDISIVNAEIVDDTFDARYWAKSKTYCYRIYYSSTRIPLLDINHAQIYRSLSVDKLIEAGKLFEGTHDFCAFANTGSNIKGTIRTIYGVEIATPTDHTVQITLVGNAFLYNMVRLIVGCMVDYARASKTLPQITAMLDGGDRERCGMYTMPSCGLTLQSVEY